MPSQICHILHGQKALDGWDEEARAQLHARIFYLGCQGPDLFYHNQRTKPSGLVYGSRLHRSRFGSFVAAAVEEARAAGWDESHPFFSYMAGFALHGALDRICHPFIIYFSGWKIPGRQETEVLRRAHIFFERMMDVLLFEHLTGELFVNGRLQEELPDPAAFSDEFTGALARALWKVYPGVYYWEDAQARVRNALNDTIGFLHWTAPSHREAAEQAAAIDRQDRSERIALFHPVVLPPADYLNLQARPWEDPQTGKSRTESFPELFGRAVDQGRRHLGAFLAAWRGEQEPRALAEILGNESLNLPQDGEEPGGPRFCRPWDFEHLLELQRRFWLRS